MNQVGRAVLSPPGPQGRAVPSPPGRKVGRAIPSPPGRGAVRTPRPTSWGFMASMHVRILEVLAFHEPGGARLRRALISQRQKSGLDGSLAPPFIGERRGGVGKFAVVFSFANVRRWGSCFSMSDLQ